MYHQMWHPLLLTYNICDDISNQQNYVSLNKSWKCIEKCIKPYHRGITHKFIHQPRFFRKSLVLFLVRVKTITTQAKIHGGKFTPEKFNFFNQSGVSLETSVIIKVIKATPTKILVTGLTSESCKRKVSVFQLMTILHALVLWLH